MSAPRLRELRQKALSYIHLHGADKPRGYVSILDLRAHLGTTDAEYKSLYLLFHNEELAKTDGMNAHIALTNAGRKEAASLGQWAVEQGNPIPPPRLKQLRDQVIRFVYEHGAGKWGWGVPFDEVSAALGITKPDLRTIVAVLRDQRLLSQADLSDIGLNEKGQEEAARLGSMPMHERSPPAITINAGNSIVQVAGAHSAQTAQLSTVDQSKVNAILDQIESELPQLSLEAGKRDEATGIAATLRKALLEKMPALPGRKTCRLR
jgi:hypothetical protein